MPEISGSVGRGGYYGVRVDDEQVTGIVMRGCDPVGLLDGGAATQIDDG